MFSKGDKVSYMGWVGHVIDIVPNTDYPVKCLFKDASGETQENFTHDGRLDIKHNRAALRLINKAKPAKKKLYPAVFFTDKDDSYYIAPRLFESEADAQNAPGKFVHLLRDREIIVDP